MKTNLKDLTLSAIFLSIGIVLPFFFGQIPQIGSMLLPMHIPVFLCAFICGAKYSVPMALILPLLRSFCFGRPNLYPDAISIAFELAAYALVTSLIYSRFKKKNIIAIYISLCTAMIVGRIIRGIVQLTLLGLKGLPFTFSAFFSGVVLYGIPGITLQLIFIPAFMAVINKHRGLK